MCAKWKNINEFFFLLHDFPNLNICPVELFAHRFTSLNINRIDPVIETLEYLPWKRYIQKAEIDLVVYFCYAL